MEKEILIDCLKVRSEVVTDDQGKTLPIITGAKILVSGIELEVIDSLEANMKLYEIILNKIEGKNEIK